MIIGSYFYTSQLFVHKLKSNSVPRTKVDLLVYFHTVYREIEDTILLALRSPEVYDDVACGTRRKFESNRPQVVLFEGPPGTRKTSSARVIANQVGIPMLFVSLEVVMSKYYGESEHLLGKVFSLANELLDGAIVFLDEVFLYSFFFLTNPLSLILCSSSPY